MINLEGKVIVSYKRNQLKESIDKLFYIFHVD